MGTKKRACMSLRSDAPISRRDAVQAISWLKKILQSRLPRRSKELITRSITFAESRAKRPHFWLRMIDKISVEDVARDVFSTRAEMRRIPPARLFPATRKRSEKNMETNELTH